MESSSSLSNTDRNRTYDYMARSEPTHAELPTGSESTGSIGAKYKLMSPAMLPISRSSCITIPPGLSPTSFLESPVLLSNMKAEASPTTGSYNQILGGFSSSPTNLITTMNLANNNSTDEEKSSFFEFKPHFRANMVSADMNNKKNEQSMQVQVQDQAHPFSSSSSMLTSEMLVPSVTVDPTEFEEDEFDQRLNKISGINSSIAGERPNNDGYNWRKYGQKHVKGCEFPRSYYKCTHPNCEVKKLFERSHDGQITDVVYKGAHDHPKPQSCSSTRVSIQEEDGKPEDSRVLANDDSNLDEVDNYDPFSKRRKMENSGFDVSTMAKPIREPRVVVQTLSEVDILDDGYRWRKYGQKVVRGNPNPRSYYKCTNVGCSVRKHVERASHDPKAVITTYEGKHNHDVPIAKTSSHDIAAGPSRFRSEESEAISLNLGVGIHTAAQNRSNDYRQSLNYVVSESETRERHFDFKVTQANTVSAHANVLNRGMNYREGHGIEITPLSHSSYPYTLSMGRIISGP